LFLFLVVVSYVMDDFIVGRDMSEKNGEEVKSYTEDLIFNG